MGAISPLLRPLAGMLRLTAPHGGLGSSPTCQPSPAPSASPCAGDIPMNQQLGCQDPDTPPSTDAAHPTAGLPGPGPLAPHSHCRIHQSMSRPDRLRAGTARRVRNPANSVMTRPQLPAASARSAEIPQKPAWFREAALCKAPQWVSRFSTGLLSVYWGITLEVRANGLWVGCASRPFRAAVVTTRR
jgi:hypothetical protein